jgi:outer membrane biosynthesis protein TonB
MLQAAVVSLVLLPQAAAEKTETKPPQPTKYTGTPHPPQPSSPQQQHHHQEQQQEQAQNQAQLQDHHQQQQRRKRKSMTTRKKRRRMMIKTSATRCTATAIRAATAKWWRVMGRGVRGSGFTWSAWG